MKKILFASLLMITSIAAFSQQPEQRERPQFERRNEMRGEFHQRPEFGPHHFPFHPKPERVIVKGDKVIVIFNKADFQRLRHEFIEREKIIYKEKEKTQLHKLLEEHLNN